jgi:hypothetical protein
MNVDWLISFLFFISFFMFIHLYIQYVYWLYTHILFHLLEKWNDAIYIILQFAFTI